MIKLSKEKVLLRWVVEHRAGETNPCIHHRRSV